MKKTKMIIGISLIVQSITFFILFLIYWNKKKNLAKTFAAFSAAGGVVGAFCLVSELKKKNSYSKIDEDEIDEDFADLDVCEDEILCSFDESEDSGEKKEAQE